jgi:hypothetical protein
MVRARIRLYQPTGCGEPNSIQFTSELRDQGNTWRWKLPHHSEYIRMGNTYSIRDNIPSNTARRKLVVFGFPRSRGSVEQRKEVEGGASFSLQSEMLCDPTEPSMDTLQQAGWNSQVIAMNGGTSDADVTKIARRSFSFLKLSHKMLPCHQRTTDL